MDTEKIKNEFSIGEDSIFRFKFREVVVVCAFIASSAITWNTIDNRITRIEERYQEVYKRFESVESQHVRDMDKQEKITDSLKIHIQDLERLIYTGKNARGG